MGYFVCARCSISRELSIESCKLASCRHRLKVYIRESQRSVISDFHSISPLISIFVYCQYVHAVAISLPGPSVALVGPRPYQARAWLRHCTCQPTITRKRLRYLDFSTKLMLVRTCSFPTTQRLHGFKFTLVNKSHSQHSVVAVRCEGRHFLILYACAHEVSFPGQIPHSLVWERH